MAKQLSLPGFLVPQRSDRVFFAVLPPPFHKARIKQLAEDIRSSQHLRADVRPAHRLHVSLHAPGVFLGGPEAMAAAINEAARATAATMPAFVVAFDSVMSFRGTRPPLVLLPRSDVTALEALYRLLGHALVRAGLGRRLRSAFTSHVTLLYGDRGIEEHAVDPITWLVEDFVLIHSVRGRGHRLLGQWTLHG
ncbi:MAG: 2'-5' RNA ligase family protein [Variibacter sp.]